MVYGCAISEENNPTSLIWNYYDGKKAAIVRKREGWISRDARISREKVKKVTTPR